MTNSTYVFSSPREPNGLPLFLAEEGDADAEDGEEEHEDEEEEHEDGKAEEEEEEASDAPGSLGGAL